MSEIALNLRAVRDGLPAGVELVAVSKYHPEEAVRAAYEAGQRTFGESREQELARKHDALPADISWHFIGHLQTNKVRFIVPYIAMIESVDSLRLLREINKQALRCGRVVDVLLELHLAQENTKTGLATDDCRAAARRRRMATDGGRPHTRYHGHGHGYRRCRPDRTRILGRLATSSSKPKRAGLPMPTRSMCAPGA